MVLIYLLYLRFHLSEWNETCAMQDDHKSQFDVYIWNFIILIYFDVHNYVYNYNKIYNWWKLWIWQINTHYCINLSNAYEVALALNKETTTFHEGCFTACSCFIWRDIRILVYLVILVLSTGNALYTLSQRYYTDNALYRRTNVPTGSNWCQRNYLPLWCDWMSFGCR